MARLKQTADGDRELENVHSAYRLELFEVDDDDADKVVTVGDGVELIMAKL